MTGAIWTDPVALAPWVMLLVAYLRRVIGMALLGGRDVPGLYGPLLACLAGPAVTLAAWALGWTGEAMDWRGALQIGLRAGITAMGGYSGIKALLDAAGARRNGGTGGTA